MAPRSRTAPRTGSAGPNLVPIILAIGVLLVAAIAVAVMQNQSDRADENAANTGAEESTQESNPFSDVDNSPKSFKRGGPALSDVAPPGLMEEPLYVNAKAAADEGLALVDEAAKARAAGDEDTYQTKGKAAQLKLEEALFATTDWLIELQEKYPNDRQVRKIENETGTWGRGLTKVRKIK